MENSDEDNHKNRKMIDEQDGDQDDGNDNPLAGVLNNNDSS